MANTTIYSVFESDHNGGADRHCLGVCSTNLKALAMIERRKNKIGDVANKNHYDVVPYAIDEDVLLDWGITGTHG